MQRKTLISLFSVALLAATVLAPAVEAQRGGQGRGDRGQGGRGGQFGGRGGGGQFGGGRGGGPGGGGGISGLLRIEAVREEIKLTEDQQELIEILADELREGRPEFPENFRDMSDEEREAFTEKMRKWGETQAEESRATLQTILEESQFKRLNEIYVQTQGTRALQDKHVAETLKLSEEQQAKVEEMLEAEGEERREAMRDLFAGGRDGGFDREAMQEKMEEFRKQSEEKVLALLTAEQKTAFTAMKGEEFAMPEGGGFGGRGGQFGGGRGRGGDGGGRGRGGDDGGRGRGGDRPQRPE